MTSVDVQWLSKGNDGVLDHFSDTVINALGGERSWFSDAKTDTNSLDDGNQEDTATNLILTHLMNGFPTAIRAALIWRWMKKGCGDTFSKRGHNLVWGWSNRAFRRNEIVKKMEPTFSLLPNRPLFNTGVVGSET